MKSKNKYNNFWKWFEKNSELIFNFENNQDNVFDLLLNELHKIDKYLTFEFGPINNNKREFILSADGMRRECTVPDIEIAAKTKEERLGKLLELLKSGKDG